MNYNMPLDQVIRSMNKPRFEREIPLTNKSTWKAYEQIKRMAVKVGIGYLVLERIQKQLWVNFVCPCGDRWASMSKRKFMRRPLCDTCYGVCKKQLRKKI